MTGLRAALLADDRARLGDGPEAAGPPGLRQHLPRVRARAPLAEDETATVDRAKAGDRAAFELIVERYDRKIYAFCYRITGNADDALDATQECFLRAYNALSRTSDDLNVSAWLHRIAANVCLDLLRRRRKIRWLPWDTYQHEHLLHGSPADDPERSVLGQEAQALVRTVLNRMNPRYRMALILREYDGLSCAEIAELMDMTVGSAKSVLFRAREEFRRIYNANGMRDA